MSVYIGYQTTARPLLEELENESWAKGYPGLSQKALDRALELREKLPEGCRIVGVYNPVAGIQNPLTPGVMVIETDDTAHLQFISNHYTGMLNYVWVPAISVGTTREALAESIERT